MSTSDLWKPTLVSSQHELFISLPLALISLTSDLMHGRHLIHIGQSFYVTIPLWGHKFFFEISQKRDEVMGEVSMARGDNNPDYPLVYR